MYSINVFHVVNAIEIFVHITLACAHTNTYERYMHTDVHTQTYSVNMFHVVHTIEIFVHNALACAHANISCMASYNV